MLISRVMYLMCIRLCVALTAITGGVSVVPFSAFVWATGRAAGRDEHQTHKIGPSSLFSAAR